MDAEALFTLANLSVLPAWALLVLAPRWSGTGLLVHSMFYPAVLGTGYTAGILLTAPGGNGVDMSSLAGLAQGFQNPSMLLVGWVHYLVFDLFVGSWECRDAARRGIPHAFVIPCLLLTFLLGPLGLVLYLVIRYVRTRVVTLAETGRTA